MDTRVIKKFATYVGLVVGSVLAVMALNLGLEKITGISWLGSVVFFAVVFFWGIYDFARAKVESERWEEQKLIDKMSQEHNESTW
jgi:hypothetical protein